MTSDSRSRRRGIRKNRKWSRHSWRRKLPLFYADFDGVTNRAFGTRQMLNCWNCREFYRLQRPARGAHKIPQHGDVRAVRADASRIHGQTQPLGLIEIHSRVIQFGKAESLRGQHAVNPRGINRTGRTVPSPRAPRQFVELLPIAFVPGGHFFRSIELPFRVLLLQSEALDARQDRKSTRLNSSHPSISYAVFCLKKKTTAE